MKERKNHGITLIALIVTIIIMLIIAGVVIAQLTGENGLITKSSLVKARTEYQSAKEEVDIKLMEIIADCEERGVEYNIDEIYEAIEKDDEKTIEKIFNKESGAVKSGVSDTIVDLSDIVVSVKKYSKYKFLVGEEGKIDGVLEGDITNTTEKTAFKSVNVFEAALLGTTVADDDTGVNNGREQIMVDKDEYEQLVADVTSLKSTVANLQNANYNKFIDTSNLIQSMTDFGEYTVKEDGWLVGYINCKNGGAYSLSIDGKQVGVGYNNSSNNVEGCNMQILVKKNSVIKIVDNLKTGAYEVKYWIYGFK